ncbi:MAG: hypothetical protein KBC36_04715 [Spirochaetia bacterium]|nr:hypothetical protein [Spirochaetia bacterium]
MKKALFPIIALAVLALLGGCGNVLHNVPASYVTFEVVNFPLDGTYAVGGNFLIDSWTNDTREIIIVDGKGSYTTPELTIAEDFYFSFMTFGTWDRPWTAYAKATPEDNTWKVSVPIDGAHHVITVDGSTNPMIATVD